MIDKFFFPHKLYKIPVGKSGFEFVCECRDQPNKSGASIAIGENKSFVYKSIVWIPKEKSKLRFLTGEKIKVIGDQGETRLDVEILKFNFGNLEEDSITV